MDLQVEKAGQLATEKGRWNLLGRLLDKVQSHSTVFNKVWLTVLFVFRILVLGTIAEKVWADQPSDFRCNTLQLGCMIMCYDQAFPISHIHFWAFQILAVATPKLFYLGHILYVLHNEKKERVKRQAKFRIFEHLPCSYVLHLIITIILEIAFIAVQYRLYGFTLSPLYSCKAKHCSAQVDCFLSRPTEKSVIIWFMLVAAFVSLVLSVVELIYLCMKAVKEFMAKNSNMREVHILSVEAVSSDVE